jgi:hypothetical protein
VQKEDAGIYKCSTKYGDHYNFKVVVENATKSSEINEGAFDEFEYYDDEEYNDDEEVCCLE